MMRMLRSKALWWVVPFAGGLLLPTFLPRSYNFPLTAGVGAALLTVPLAQWAGFARRLPRRAPLARAAVPLTAFLGALPLAARRGSHHGRKLVAVGAGSRLRGLRVPDRRGGHLAVPPAGVRA
jgi:hypothetical protein